MPYIPVLFICVSMASITMETPNQPDIEDETCAKLSSVGYLNEDTHARCLQSLILAAHDLARDVMVTPKRIQYAREGRIDVQAVDGTGIKKAVRD